MAYKGFCAHHGPWQDEFCPGCGPERTRHTDPDQAEEFREIAVQIVDERHGFTAEHAPDPAAHRQEYEDELDHVIDELGRPRHDILEAEIDGITTTLAIRRGVSDPPLTEEQEEAFKALAEAAVARMNADPRLGDRQEQKLRELHNRFHNQAQEGTDV